MGGYLCHGASFCTHEEVGSSPFGEPRNTCQIGVTNEVGIIVILRGKHRVNGGLMTVAPGRSDYVILVMS